MFHILSSSCTSSSLYLAFDQLILLLSAPTKVPRPVKAYRVTVSSYLEHTVVQYIIELGCFNFSGCTRITGQYFTANAHTVLYLDPVSIGEK